MEAQLLLSAARVIGKLAAGRGSLCPGVRGAVQVKGSAPSCPSCRCSHLHAVDGGGVELLHQLCHPRGAHVRCAVWGRCKKLQMQFVVHSLCGSQGWWEGQRKR